MFNSYEQILTIEVHFTYFLCLDGVHDSRGAQPEPAPP